MRYSQVINKVLSLLLIAVSTVVLGGWVFQIKALQAGLPGHNVMKFNAALCFLCCGILLLLIEKKDKAAVWSCRVLISFVFLIGLLTFLQHILALDFGIDELFFRDESAGAYLLGQRMSASSAFNFLLLATVFYYWKKPKLLGLFQGILAFISISAFIAILNHFSNVNLFRSLAFFTLTAFHTAVLFLILCYGILVSPRFNYHRFSFQKQILVSFVSLTLILILLFNAFQKTNTQFINASELVLHTNRVMLVNQRILNEALDIESGARGYVISGNEQFLTSYKSAAADIQNLVDSLRQLTGNHPSQQVRIDSLEKLVEQSLQLRNTFIRLRKENGPETALREVAKGQGLAISNQMRSVIDAIEEEQAQLLALQKADNEKIFKNPSQFILTIFGLSLLILLSTLWIIFRNTQLRDKAEASLKKNKKLISAIIDNTSNPISLRDPEGNYLLVNDAVRKLAGQPLVNKNLEDIWPRELALATKELDKAVIRTGTACITEEKVHVHNKTRYFNTCKFPVLDEHNNVYAVGSVATDITELKLAEQKIRELNKSLEKQVAIKTQEIIEKEKQYRFLLENMREGIQIIGFDWKYLFVNESVARQGRYTPDQLIGSTMMEKYPGIEKTELFQVLHACMTERKEMTYESEFYFFNGSNEWYELSIQPVPEGLFILTMDITERKLAEERLQLALEAGEIGWWELDLVNKRSIRNLNHDKMFGYNQLLDHWNQDVFMQHVHPQDREIAKQAFERAADTKKLELKLRITRIDGATRWISAQGKLKDYNTPQPRMLGTVIDITELKLAEERIIRHAEELKRSNTELEHFAYVASHDLQEPIRMVSSFLNLLEKRLNGQLDPTNKQYIDFAVDGAERMKSLINDLLQYSRISSNKENLESVDLNEVMDYVRRLLAEHIDCSRALLNVQPLPTITANKSLINQLFINLVNNAIKFRGEQQPVVEIGVIDKTTEWIFFVRDNGIGIDPKFFDKVFIIFQRLHSKSEYAGTGIGLAICKKIVETHQGRIWIESKPKQGSSFYFSLPKK